MSGNRNNRIRPAFRLRELMGPEFREAYPRNLAEALHRAFDRVTDEPLPGSLAELVDSLKLSPSGPLGNSAERQGYPSAE